MEEKKVTKNDLFRTFVRSNFLLGSFNFERMQAIGFCVSMVSILKRIYKGDELKAALKRHLEFFNTQPFVAAATRFSGARFDRCLPLSARASL